MVEDSVIDLCGLLQCHGLFHHCGNAIFIPVGEGTKTISAWGQEITLLGKLYLGLLGGEGQEDVFLCARSFGHVLLLVVKVVVAGLGAADHLGQRVVLQI